MGGRRICWFDSIQNKKEDDERKQFQKGSNAILDREIMYIHWQTHHVQVLAVAVCVGAAPARSSDAA